VFNYSPIGVRRKKDFVLPPDSPKYCLRAKCLKERKRAGEDGKVELTDVWSDIHRVKHKRDRERTPCQLPPSVLARAFAFLEALGAQAILGRIRRQDEILLPSHTNWRVVEHGSSARFGVVEQRVVRPASAFHADPKARPKQSSGENFRCC